MHCDHCTAIREEQEAFIAAHADTALYPGLYASKQKGDPMTRDLNGKQWGTNWPPELRASVSACDCDCHTPQRIVGLLPRLNVTP